MIELRAVQISSLSTEYVRVPTSARSSGSYVDPTSFAVQMAFTVNDTEPVGGDWKAAVWVTDVSTYYIQCLIGPAGGTVTLSNGSYDVWVKINASPETVIRRVGYLVVE